MKKLITIMCLLLPAVVLADKSDYIWNMQFEQKLELAQKGDVKAQYDVANMYLKGQGTTRSAEKAFEWYEKAAQQNHVSAVYKIGYLYSKGEGVEKDYRKAYDWIKRAAEQDYRPAMFYLGKLYASGAGTGKDLNAALRWFEKADEAGYHPAKKAIAETRAELAQLARQQQAAATPPPVASAAPVVRPAPRQAPRPAAAPVAAAASSQDEAIAMIAATKWLQNGKPADVLPSAQTDCQVRNNLIACASEDLKENQPYGVVTYRVESMIGNFKGNKFSTQYRKNVTLILPAEPDNPKAKIPIEYGPQPPVRMECELLDNKGVSCKTPDNKLLVYSKL